MSVSVTRYHDFSCAHRAVNDPSKCKNIHGHNYRVHFTITAAPDAEKGRVVDFSLIKSTIIQWIEDNWDHKLLLWGEDPLWHECIHEKFPATWDTVLSDSILRVPFNTSSENMAIFLAAKAQAMMVEAGHPHVQVTEVRVEETRKCGAKWEK